MMLAHSGVMIALEVTDPMLLLFICPDCGHEHSEPADAAYVLAVRCDHCDLAAILADRLANLERSLRDIPAAA